MTEKKAETFKQRLQRLLGIDEGYEVVKELRAFFEYQQKELPAHQTPISYEEIKSLYDVWLHDRIVLALYESHYFNDERIYQHTVDYLDHKLKVIESERRLAQIGYFIFLRDQQQWIFDRFKQDKGETQ
jgi:hypothetical protein